MRLQIIATRNPAPSDVNHSLCLLLQKELAENEGLTLTEKAPDIAHVFGDWDNKTLSVMRRLHNCRIPIIYTSLKGLQAVSDNGFPGNAASMRRNRSRIINMASVFHVCGEKERQAVEKRYCKTATTQIYNPAVTTLATPQDTVSKAISLYEGTAAKHDQHIRQAISERVGRLNCKDAGICEICRQILYIKYMMLRGGITQELLETLSATMTCEQYDEELMAEVVKSLNIMDFSASLLSVLEKRAALTEGFMPFAAVSNKLSNSIENNILTI